VNTAANIAIAYRKRGWFPIPIPTKSKAPPLDMKEWQNLRLSVEDIPKYFVGRMNIGVLTGSVSKNLTDIDLDCQSAIRLANQFLTPTIMFGRDSKPRSHWIYTAFGSRTESFVTPQRLWGLKEQNGEKIKPTTLLELRADGKQTIFPQGIHECGENIEWVTAFDQLPEVVQAETLRSAVAKLATACLLIHFGWDDDDAVVFTQHPNTTAITTLAPEVQHLVTRWLGPAVAAAQPRAVKPAKEPTTAFEIAVVRWNDDHPIAFVKRNSGPCPVCDDHKSFGQLRDNPEKWSCFSTDHPDDVGKRDPGQQCYWGDALDLEAYKRQKTRNDVLREDGYYPHLQVVQTPASRAPETTPDPSPAEAQPSPTEPPHDDTPGSGDPPSDEDFQPEIQLSPLRYEVIQEAIQALTLCKNTYQRGHQLVRVVVSEAPPAFISFTQPAPLIKAIPAVSIGISLTKHAKIVQYNNKEKKLVGAHPPDWLSSGIEKQMEYKNIRPLSGIVEIPTLRPNGTMIDTPGYDPATGLVYRPSLEFSRITGSVSLEDAKKAVADILDLVCDFPFAGPQYKSAWLASLLTPFARSAINGPAPLFMVDSNVRGAGKSKLCDVVSIIVTARPMARMSNPPHDEEFKKLITSAAIAGTRQLMIDNITGPFGSQALDAALTSTTWQDRILGHSEMTSELPLSITWYATGNNIQIVGDLCRRTIHIRIESPEEKPEERQQFKYPDLLGHALHHRAEYVNAVLTVLRAYCDAGRPQQKLRRMDYVAWSDFVRGAIVFAGLEDPGITQLTLAEADSASEGLALFIEALAAKDGGYGMSVKTILDLAQSPDEELLREAVHAICPTRNGLIPTTQQFGVKLHTLKRRVVDGRHIDLAGKTKSKRTSPLWCVREGAPSTRVEK
jgi:hypothetical protein